MARYYSGCPGSHAELESDPASRGHIVSWFHFHPTVWSLSSAHHKAETYWDMVMTVSFMCRIDEAIVARY